MSIRVQQRLDVLASSLCTGKCHTDMACCLLHEFYGNLFRCPFPSCSRHFDGFETTEKRDRHINKHKLPFKCNSLGCEFRYIGFETSEKLDVHTKTYHTMATPISEVHTTWAGMDVQACTRMLYAAAKSGDLSLISSLLSLFQVRNGWRLNYKEALRKCIQGSSPEALELILFNCPHKVNGDQYLSMTITRHQELLTQYSLGVLTSSGFEGNGVGVPELSARKEYKAISRIIRLLHDSDKVDSGPDTFMQAAEKDQEETIRLLIESGVNSRGGIDSFTAFRRVAEKGSETIMALLIDKWVELFPSTYFHNTSLSPLLLFFTLFSLADLNLGTGVL